MGLLASYKHILLKLMILFLYWNFSQFASHKANIYSMTELLKKHSLLCTDSFALINYRDIPNFNQGLEVSIGVAV